MRIRLLGGAGLTPISVPASSESRRQAQKSKVMEAGIYPARGFYPALRGTNGLRVGFWSGGAAGRSMVPARHDKSRVFASPVPLKTNTQTALRLRGPAAAVLSSRR